MGIKFDKYDVERIAHNDETKPGVRVDTITEMTGSRGKQIHFPDERAWYKVVEEICRHVGPNNQLTHRELVVERIGDNKQRTVAIKYFPDESALIYVYDDIGEREYSGDWICPHCHRLMSNDHHKHGDANEKCASPLCDKKLSDYVQDDRIV